MNELFTAFSTGIIAFIATNIDDIVILLLFFSQVNANLNPWQIVAGQYLGFTTLIILSLPGFFGGMILPPKVIGLLGLIPIVMGINSLVNKESITEDVSPESTPSTTTTITDLFTPQVYSIAAITLANGGDNISVYVPLFANSNLTVFFIIICSFIILLGIWCYAAYRLTYQKNIADILTRYSNYLVPFVLIGIGTFIVLKSSALSLVKLVASCLCLMILLKNNSVAESKSELGDRYNQTIGEHDE
ncbi:cadmium resistance transporter [Nostoc sp. TCL26-01]|uniref:cadmium resistance transporter n=1 Tax=Nostoc sp. TCL26-01 TaxID=2576904 RepID=UPI0015BF43E2|nr:cadmium resistance transporter [Nostoc sp. TCL26-01]QLE54487.1 transporter [Nostoc sp. TCL26-01]